MSTEKGHFSVEVIADSSGEWCGNALTFPTCAAAEAYAKDLWSRWTAVRSWRVVEQVASGWILFKRVVGVSA